MYNIVSEKIFEYIAVTVINYLKFSHGSFCENESQKKKEKRKKKHSNTDSDCISRLIQKRRAKIVV